MEAMDRISYLKMLHGYLPESQLAKTLSTHSLNVSALSEAYARGYRILTCQLQVSSNALFQDDDTG